jgi:hypothetical protein
MMCRRCGTCCYRVAVVVRLGDDAYLKPADVLCPHLRFEAGPRGNLAVATCAVHDEPWYRDTACFAARRAPADASWVAGERPCAVGELVAASASLRARLLDAPRPDLERLQHLGPWELVPRRAAGGRAG